MAPAQSGDVVASSNFLLAQNKVYTQLKPQHRDFSHSQCDQEHLELSHNLAKVASGI
jgi:hypothetical protein